MRRFILATSGVLWAALVMSAQQQSEQAIKPLVVMLDVKIAGSDDYGAGIISGVVSNRLYIATANHVVRKEGKEADSIKVGFSWLPGETRTARLLANYDEQLDLAIILVDNASELAIPQLPLGQIALASSLKKGDLVFPMGYPNRQGWSTRALPDAIASVQDGLRFDTNYLVPGNSGGALLTSAWRIVALITERSGAQGSAIPIEHVIDKLRAWNYQVQLNPGGDAQPAAGVSAHNPALEGRSSTASIRPGRYEIRLIEIRPLGVDSMAPMNGTEQLQSSAGRIGSAIWGIASGSRSAVQDRMPQGREPRQRSASRSPGFLHLEIVVNRIPLLHLQRVSLPYRPGDGEAVAEVDIQRGQELMLNMRGLTNVVRDGGRHGQPHSIREILREGDDVAVNMVFPDGDGSFVFRFAVVRK